MLIWVEAQRKVMLMILEKNMKNMIADIDTENFYVLEL